VIEQITLADVGLAAGDQDDADAILQPAIDASCRHRLPHQIQRIARIAERTGNPPPGTARRDRPQLGLLPPNPQRR
jgi:hypothetical protein